MGEISWREPELAALANRYGDNVVVAALRIQRHIQTNGIEGIFFKQKGEERLDQLLPAVTNRKCTKHMKAELRKTRRRK